MKPGSELGQLAPLASSLARHGVGIVADVETSVAAGTFRARVALSEARLRELSRSWEAFDRAFERLEASDERALLERCLWPALDEMDDHLDAALDDADTNDVAFTLPGECLGIWPGDVWQLRLAEWRRSRAAFR